MLLAVRRLLAAFDTELRRFGAGVMCAKPAADVYHSVLSMSLAVNPRLAALEVKVRCPYAGVLGA